VLKTPLFMKVATADKNNGCNAHCCRSQWENCPLAGGTLDAMGDMHAAVDHVRFAKHCHEMPTAKLIF
jgi:hypothetical protein